MTAAKVSLLEDRGVVSVTGEDALKFLDNLITNDMALLDRQGAISAGLLTPQGKILFEFFVVKAADGYLLDTAKDKAAELVKRLLMYKLRANVSIADRSGNFDVLAAWGEWCEAELPAGSVTFGDSRNADLGWRRLVQRPESMRGTISMLVSRPTPFDDYAGHRILLGVPEGGQDYAFGEVFPHEALFDQLHGVSFTKGCYVGQEIVARMEHRGAARRRFVRVTSTAALPPMGTDVLAGEVVVGAMGSSAGMQGLALLRLDRVAEFAAQGVGFTVGGVPITPEPADVARLMPQSPDRNEFK